VREGEEERQRQKERERENVSVSLGVCAEACVFVQVHSCVYFFVLALDQCVSERAREVGRD